MNIHLADIKSWQYREDDEKWQKYVFERYVPRLGESAEYIEKVKKEIGNIRIRPEEVASAGNLYPPTVSFEDCIIHAEEIKSLYDEHYSTPTRTRTQ